jgi:predicted ester cyclase
MLNLDMPRKILVSILLLLSTFCLRAGEKEERNKTLVERYSIELWEKGNLSIVDQLWAPDVKAEVTAWKGNNLQTIKNDVGNYLKSFTHVKTVTTHLVAEGDWVVRRWKTSGKHVGVYSGVKPTNKIITMQGTEFFRIKDGKIVEDVSDWDAYDAYTQLGIIKELQQP